MKNINEIYLQAFIEIDCSFNTIKYFEETFKNSEFNLSLQENSQLHRYSHF